MRSVVIVAAATVVSQCAAQSKEVLDAIKAARLRQAKDAPQLPADPASWINSPPLSLAALEGKGVVLYFFEETCPVCRERWPELLATAKKFADKPVAFIAVNSGTPRAALQKYAQECHIDWPMIVDTSRQFEQAASVGPISLDNIYQIRVITSGGKIMSAQASGVEGAAKMALDGAAWTVDPANMPSAMRSTWLAVELGNYALAAPAIKKELRSAGGQARDAAKRLEAELEQKKPVGPSRPQSPDQERPGNDSD